MKFKEKLKKAREKRLSEKDEETSETEFQTVEVVQKGLEVPTLGGEFKFATPSDLESAFEEEEIVVPEGKPYPQEEYDREAERVSKTKEDMEKAITQLKKPQKIELANGSSITSHPQAKPIKGLTPLDDFKKEFLAPFDTPVEFAENILGVELTPAQYRILEILNTTKDTKGISKGKKNTDLYLQNKIKDAWNLFFSITAPQFEVKKKEND